MLAAIAAPNQPKKEIIMATRKPKVKLSEANAPHPFAIGENYLIRTVTNYLTGRVVGVTATEIVLVSASWIADTGRFSDALKKSAFNEVEPFPDGDVIVGRGALIDACRIAKLPREQV